MISPSPLLPDRICACLEDGLSLKLAEIRKATGCASEWLLGATLDRLVEQGRIEIEGSTYRLTAGSSDSVPPAQLEPVDFAVTESGEGWRLWASGVAAADFPLQKRAHQCAEALKHKGLDPRRLKSPKARDQFLGLVVACQGTPLAVSMPRLMAIRKLQAQVVQPEVPKRGRGPRPGRPPNRGKAPGQGRKAPDAEPAARAPAVVLLTAPVAAVPPVTTKEPLLGIPATAEQITKVHELAVQGLKARQIAPQVGLGSGTVAKVLKSMALGKGGRHA